MINITVKATFIHPQAGTYETKLDSGENIPNPVFFKEKPNGDIEAYVDDTDCIGVVQEKDFEIPKVYEAHLKEKGAEAKTFIVEVECEVKTSGGSYESEAKAAVSKGFSEDEVNERITYMTEEGFHPSVIVKTLEWLASYGKPEICAKITDGPLYRKTAADSPIEQMVISGVIHNALILFGEKSTGKNVASHTCAWLLGLQEERIGFQRDMGIDDAFGGKGTDNSAAESLTPELAFAKLMVLSGGENSENYMEDAAKYECLSAQAASIHVVQNESSLIRWAKEGGVMMFDEVNMAHANLLQAIMNPLCDGDKTLVVPGGERIKVHPACVLFGGMNPGYTGTMELNKATASRCGFLEFKLADSIAPQLKANFKATKKLSRHITACDKLYTDFKAAVSQGRISNDCLNIRGFVNALKAVEAFPEAVSLAKQVETFVINACSDEERLLLSAMLRDKIDF